MPVAAGFATKAGSMIAAKGPPMSATLTETRRLNRDHGHCLHIERHGAAGGVPTLFLHGGPGAGIGLAALGGFDLTRHDMVMFDQRGCGKSTPLGVFAGNTTADLIGDIEAIRQAFGFERWIVCGGSWGSYLALAYAQAHPDRVLGLRVHGIFLARDSDIHWWFQGVRDVFPEEWEQFAALVTPSERDDLLSAYYARLTSDQPEVVERAAWHLRNFSARTQTFEVDEAHIATLLAVPEKYIPVARLFTHYCKHHAFQPPNAILDRLDAIRAIPTEILQGRYDMVTPVRSAWDLHKALPEARFTLVTLSNHTTSPAMREALRAASDRLRDRIGIA